MCRLYIIFPKCEAKNTVFRRIDPNAYYEHFYREAERAATRMGAESKG